VPIRRRKQTARAATGRLLYVDKSTAGRIAGESRALPRVSDMPVDVPVLIVGDGVPAFKVEHVGAALKARGARGYWLVQLQARSYAPARSLAETLIGFAGLNVTRIDSAAEL